MDITIQDQIRVTSIGLINKDKWVTTEVVSKIAGIVKTSLETADSINQDILVHEGKNYDHY